VEVLALIPARGGSRGLPHKNLAELAGRPLLAYTADCVNDCRTPLRAVLSTDDERIARLGVRLGLETPFRRPAELADDATPTLPVVQHALARLSADEGYRPEVVVVLQPTSPLRTGRHLDEALELFAAVACDSLLSLAPVESHPAWAWRVEDGLAAPLKRERPPRRQELPPLYRPNGALYLTTPELLAADRLLGEAVAAYVMEPWESVDVDDDWDLAVAEAALIYRRGRA
jgi:CMP-N-acetylneuraminic acid synthetase